MKNYLVAFAFSYKNGNTGTGRAFCSSKKIPNTKKEVFELEQEIKNGDENYNSVSILSITKLRRN